MPNLGPTVEQATIRLVRLATLVVVLPLVLAGVQIVLSGVLMMFLWWAGAVVVGVGTMRIERYLLRKNR